VGHSDEPVQLFDSTSEADKRLFVTFYTDEIKNEAKTKDAGRPIYDTVEFCRIQVPGDRDVIEDRVESMALELDRDPRTRFPAAYAKFRARESNQYSGTPLREAGGVVPTSRAKEYEHFGVMTVEHLAGLSDINAQKILGSVTERQRAKDFLEAAKGRAPVDQLRAEVEALKAQLAARDEARAPKKGKAA
jgi:hypothetical protein